MIFKNYSSVFAPETIAQKFQRALTLHQSGQLDAAASLYDAIIKQQPLHFDSLHLRGVIAAQTGRFQDAAHLIAQALEIDRNHTGAYFNLGNSLKELGRLREAAVSFGRAIVLQPDFFESLFNAIGVMEGLGLMRGALAYSQRAVRLIPGYLDAQINLGNIQNKLNCFSDAAYHASAALVLWPASFEGCNELGIAAHGLAQEKQALQHFQHSHLINPAFLDAINNLGNLQAKLGQFDNAALSYLKNIVLDPASANAWYNFAFLLRERGNFIRAIWSYKIALRCKPNFANALAHKLSAEAMICDWQDFENNQPAIETLGVLTEAVDPFAMLSFEDHPERHKLRSIKYAQEKWHFTSDRKFKKPLSRPERLRIGYFSADFTYHAVMHLAAGLFEHHDKTRFEVHAFNISSRPDNAMRDRVIGAVDHFHFVEHKSDLEIANFSADLNIDIAIDLNGYTADGQPGIFAHRAAPVQISYLGYPGTTGAAFFDYLIADRFVIPNMDGASHTEKLIHMPDCYQVNDDKRPISTRAFSRTELGLPEGRFVFCCFNNTYKITPREFDIWMRLLGAVDGSILWLLQTNEYAKANLQQAAQSRGIDPARLIFAAKMPQADHLARHRSADLFLDTFNYNAHTAASDALWAGLPVVTKAGHGFPARVAGSILSTLGIPELITDGESAYEALAFNLAIDPVRLTAIKAKIAEKIQVSPMFKTNLFARNLEDALDRVFASYMAN